jgi:hypothetical protein
MLIQPLAGANSFFLKSIVTTYAPIAPIRRFGP